MEGRGDESSIFIYSNALSTHQLMLDTSQSQTINICCFAVLLAALKDDMDLIDETNCILHSFTLHVHLCVCTSTQTVCADNLTGLADTFIVIGLKTYRSEAL